MGDSFGATMEAEDTHACITIPSAFRVGSWWGTDRALLVLSYGIGMAAALVGTGLLLVLARDRFERWSVMRPGSRELPGVVIALRLTRALPILTAVEVIGIGGWIAIRSLMTI